MELAVGIKKRVNYVCSDIMNFANGRKKIMDGSYRCCIYTEDLGLWVSSDIMMLLKKLHISS